MSGAQGKRPAGSIENLLKAGYLLARSGILVNQTVTTAGVVISREAQNAEARGSPADSGDRLRSACFQTIAKVVVAGHEPVRNLKRLGLLVPGGDMPELSAFTENAGTFVAACKADLDLHRQGSLDG